MPNYLHRTTKQYLHSFPEIELPETVENYIFMPDMSAVEGVPSKYWIITGDVVSEMSQGEKDAVDAAILDAARDSVASQVDELESLLRQYIKISGIENNILRAKLGLLPRTFDQLKTAIRNGLGS